MVAYKEFFAVQRYIVQQKPMFSCSVLRNRFVDSICVWVHQRSDSWEISKLKGLQTCQNHCQIDSDLITEVMLIIAKRESSMSVATIQGIVARNYRHAVSYWKAWTTK